MEKSIARSFAFDDIIHVRQTMMRKENGYKERIITDPKIMVGKPVVAGTRIPVEHILGRLAENPDLTELFAAYPELTAEDVEACLHYAKIAVGRKRTAAPPTNL